MMEQFAELYMSNIWFFSIATLAMLIIALFFIAMIVVLIKGELPNDSR